jgi:hypothetical protein
VGTSAVGGKELKVAEFYESIDAKRADFIANQPMFFVATAPSDGRVNLSPKGMDSFRVLGPNRVAYLDLTGSGNETAAHLLQNHRITFMFCSFSRNPLIVRLYGHGRVVQAKDAEWRDLSVAFPTYPGVRQIISADIFQVQTSCGFGVPQMTLERARPTLSAYWEKRGETEARAYRLERNMMSIDGLPTGYGE